ncbi:hypothetical protein FV242_31325 [Methylobacterium sp. WL64]|uniref:hypothetical protein n=1 Tax=Methylobacterium sp. WL64 TaxID=2603894 RepID=UPI0011C96D19|nr:hypothetical protein [Methylobacterium sp. WL64]TXM97525.1 hypothetical protein FV242_31325 [Methylobacterium sp. WL64]
MKRPLTTSTAAPPPGQHQASRPAPAEAPPPAPTWRETTPVAAALIAILSAVESSPRAGPATKAYRSAMRRQGEEAAAIGGIAAMEAVLRQVAEVDADHADVRVAIVRAAWAGVSG